MDTKHTGRKPNTEETGNKLVTWTQQINKLRKSQNSKGKLVTCQENLEMAMAWFSVILPSFYPLKIQNKQRSPMTGSPQAEVVMF